MARKVHITYRHSNQEVVIVWFHGKPLERDRAYEATHCDYCGESRKFRQTCFYTYDSYDEAFCNLNCFGAYVASGRMSSARELRVKRALAVIDMEDAKARRKARAAERVNVAA